MRKIKIDGEYYIPITTGPLNDLVGKIVKKVVEDDCEIYMLFGDGTAVRFYHDQDCCEDVHIEEVAGDWTSLYGHPLLLAEVRTEDDEVRSNSDDIQWTFYAFRNIGGTVDVRWYGSSNGYYSVDVSHKFYGKEQIDIKDCM